MKKRIDRIDSDGERSVTVWDRNGGPAKDGIVYIYEEGEWIEILRSDGGDSFNGEALQAEQRVNNAFSEPVSDLTKYYVIERIGFNKQANQTILGKTCEVYGGVYPEKIEGINPPKYHILDKRGAEEEIAVWNGITMRLKYTHTKKDGTTEIKIPLEAQAVTLTVPDSAFTKTLDTAWLK